MEIRHHIDRALDFLNDSQTIHGDFKTYISSRQDMSECMSYVNTTYITTFVLYALEFVQSDRVGHMKDSAMRFLIEEMELPGIWRFFGVDRDTHFSQGKLFGYTRYGIVPDLDDTACVSFCLKKNGVILPENREIFLKNQNSEGLFMTWLMDYPKREEYKAQTVYMQPKDNDICAGVNANVLLYLGDGPYAEAISRYLEKVLKAEDIGTHLGWFPNNGVLEYLISRAYYNGACCLDRCRSLVLKRLGSRTDKGVIGSVLETAYDICTYLNINASDNYMENRIRFLMDMQSGDGSWKKERFCDGGPYYYGSEALTTAICIEALARYAEVVK